MYTKIDLFLDSHPYATTTKRTYKDILKRLLTEWDPANMTASDLVKFLEQQGWGNKRQCVALAASQKYIAWQFGRTHPALQARIKRLPSKPQRALNPQTALKLLASFNPHCAKGARDLALCSLALDTGLRESELCRLQLTDTNLEHCVLLCLVKGGKWKPAIFTEQTRAHLSQWLAYRKAAPGIGNLFTNTLKGKHFGKALTPEGLGSIVKEWGVQIGIKISPHDLRRSLACLATELMDAPERALMDMGRWENSDMIKGYTLTLRLEAMRKYLPMIGLMRLNGQVKSNIAK